MLFFLQIDGSLMLKFYLIFSLFGCFYCIRAKSFFTFSFYNSRGKFITSHLRDINPVAQHSKVLKDVFFTRNLFKTGEIQGIPVVDHIIVVDDSFYSFYEHISILIL